LKLTDPVQDTIRIDTILQDCKARTWTR